VNREIKILNRCLDPDENCPVAAVAAASAAAAADASFTSIASGSAPALHGLAVPMLGRKISHIYK
jgi:hypothetical protein